ncbi:Aspartyl/glutamyl-tRNA(Asn/Gln) amidotransferase subunit C [Chlamydia avium]|uniref:Aspartyl/glutamyl-tRNA(Asn/Gln) amidotransferase subunit C n=2 Tax=Chlamydia avium TaxID=1457141 RepID=W8JQ48_9CHLA|nr:Asp-tRNA(Asn)/Glu-tRNA(Gln) amidotransferase subunit GatC [Chlamydia avium]AHK62978.1 Glutamyl-tRNA(Gln) amidotransferase subunit C [Chlamydia avium 10DC88]EPP38176.1 aspartyl/glutamyl-tRNA(Asn/Gln) amidotransferase, C subunit [Chlamydia avium]VVT42596.1 Aspartyl/glutamyl-tRNA(Asn/Gln) amidotransferase subunit C [Chlamydia avium]
MKRTYLEREDIVTLAKLSALDLSEELIQEYSTSLNDVIHTMEETISMDVVDVVDDLPLIQVVGPEDLREDIVTSNFSREEFLTNVPESLGGLVKVPTIIK